MKFVMLMIPAVYKGGGPAPGFTPNPNKIKEMDRFNEELGKALKVESLNGLYPLVSGARVSFAKGKPTVTDGPFIDERSVGRLLAGGGAFPRRSREVGHALPGGRWR
jgi:hypothetical protein